jgi:gentisate 1,2-dioxygenase
MIWVIEGQGYDLHDGVRWEWKAGQYICIPPMTAHQHFNTDPERPALMVSASPLAYAHLGLGGIEQLEDAP